jgi:hypothetical protein
MSPRWGSKPRRIDQLVVSRNVTLTLSLSLESAPALVAKRGHGNTPRTTVAKRGHYTTRHMCFCICMTCSTSYSHFD